MIRTINLNGSEVKVTELGGDNTQIFNNSGNTLYASKMPNITVGGDNVIAIPAGAIDGLYGTRGTVYLLGSGSVEVRGVDHKIANVRGATVINENGGVTEENIDQKCGVILDSAKDYADEKDIETLENAKEYVDSLNAELAGYIGYTDNDVYGLEADFENCIFTRLAGAVGKTSGVDFDSVNAYGGRRRCNLSDNGEVLAYYGDENFKADGSNGQVMVEQPKFYYRVVPLKTKKIDGASGFHLCKARYYISDTPKAGFKVHPAFVKNGVEVDRIYLSAFDCCIYDSSAGAYLLEDEQIADFDNDKLSSIAGSKPCTGTTQQLTWANARKIARNRGKGWEQYTIQIASAIQLLFIIEYADFNAQSALANGVISYKDTSTGSTVILGNASGETNDQDISYRGEENPWGIINKFIDGIKIYNPGDFSEANSHGEIHIFEVDSANRAFEDNPEKVMFPSEYGYGYISCFGYCQEHDWLFIPTAMDGNSRLPVGDSCLNRRGGNRIALFWGGGGTGAGFFFENFGLSSAYHADNVGSRLTYFPSK